MCHDLFLVHRKEDTDREQLNGIVPPLTTEPAVVVHIIVENQITELVVIQGRTEDLISQGTQGHHDQSNLFILDKTKCQIKEQIKERQWQRL